ncbi:phosphomannomutase/phosphoglucomutase [Marinobacter sp. SS8-8]|uniref:phosphomannomutase/phosphoglucomutase n=1 Tax=Marinobacter sp. SS8-8 TaxID=3050452 RepID=UPI000C6AB0C0|nr:phosphomannomutase/phosphoglucomutase [Marinobacter sp. SS8-8]MAZ05848.1 phosphomannomutase [Halomonas sp.]|tara:strand:+ start:41534 stop:44164 length:2631 start_codon:yes stop_codon:yes gene_type:complete
MKLGKKKAADASVDEKPAKKENARTAGPRLKRLSSVAMNQSLVVVLAGMIAVALLHFLVVQPSAQARFASLKALEADAAALRLNQYFDQVQKSINGLATQPHVIQALNSRNDIPVTELQLANFLPAIEEVHLFPYRDIPRASTGDGLLGFSGLELARRAETGQRLFPDAFPRDNRWFVQIAAPVRNPTSNAVIGSLLIIFDTGQIQPLLKVVNASLGGELALVQTVSGASRTVVSNGSGSGSAESRRLTNPDWTVAYTPAKVSAAPVGTVMIAILVGAPALIAAIIIWVLLGGAQKGLRQDVTALIQWAHKVFGGERVKLPTFRWDMVASAGEVLFRLSQVVDKRVAKAGETAKPKPASSGKSGAGASKGSDEPLFQDKDMPDIDMLDGDEDVLGFGTGDDTVFGSGDTPDVEEVGLPQVELSRDIFRAYDIRGIVGETLTAEGVQVIGRAIGSEALARGVDSLCIGYDGRHSSPDLAGALARGVMVAGCNVIHVGAVPTPVLYFATHELQTGSGVMVTGSHNPANYNGLKIMLGGETLSGEAIQKLYQRIQTGDFASGQGNQSSEDVRRAYLDRILGDIAVAAPLKVVVDAGNGIAGELGPMLIEELGCEVVPLYCDVDGDFPNHHPDPGKPANLTDLIARVESEGADIGLAFDGDGDRLGVVTDSGKIIWPDRLMMLFARDVVSRNPGTDVLYDVKCSRRLAGVISEAGGRPIMWKSGHSLMKAKMKETGALLAGEMSGHIFFGERWYGFDDGLYSAARLLEILGVEDRRSDEVFEDFPDDISTPELNVEVTDSAKFDIIARLGEAGDFGDGNISTIDGIRVDYADGWGLCRASNTTPALVLRFEAETEEALERIKSVFREQLRKAAPDLVADF